MTQRERERENIMDDDGRLEITGVFISLFEFLLDKLDDDDELFLRLSVRERRGVYKTPLSPLRHFHFIFFQKEENDWKKIILSR